MKAYRAPKLTKGDTERWRLALAKTYCAPKLKANEIQGWRKLFDELFEATIAARRSGLDVGRSINRDVIRDGVSLGGIARHKGLDSGEVVLRLPNVTKLRHFLFKQ